MITKLIPTDAGANRFRKLQEKRHWEGEYFRKFEDYRCCSRYFLTNKQIPLSFQIYLKNNVSVSHYCPFPNLRSAVSLLLQYSLRCIYLVNKGDPSPAYCFSSLQGKIAVFVAAFSPHHLVCVCAADNVFKWNSVLAAVPISEWSTPHC